MKYKLKRLFDVVCCTLALFVLLPVYLVLAIGIKLSSPGPLFYKASRMGKDGKKFSMLKFRSMHIGSNARENSFIADEERLFPFGMFIRRSKLDELPQLVNIVKGDMSIVGPRPASMANANELLVGKYKDIMSALPGLTSYASLFDYKHGELFITDNEKYISEILPVKLELELYYAHNWSLGKDMELIVQTVYYIFRIALGEKVFKYTKLEQMAMNGLLNKQVGERMNGI